MGGCYTVSEIQEMAISGEVGVLGGGGDEITFFSSEAGFFLAFQVFGGLGMLSVCVCWMVGHRCRGVCVPTYCGVEGSNQVNGCILMC